MTSPQSDAYERFPGDVTVPRALLAEAYRGLKRHYEMPEVRREIDRILALRAAPPTTKPSSARAVDTVWFIENDKSEWWIGGARIFATDPAHWTRDPLAARHYKRRIDAQDACDRLGHEAYAKVTGHIFLDASPSFAVNDTPARPARTLIERLRAAGRDERLSTGALYLEAADALALSATGTSVAQRLEQRGVYMPPGILVRVQEWRDALPGSATYKDDPIFLAALIEELWPPSVPTDGTTAVQPKEK